MSAIENSQGGEKQDANLRESAKRHAPLLLVQNIFAQGSRLLSRHWKASLHLSVVP